LRKFAIEEVYELADAIDAGDDAALAEELGDVLLQILLHSQIADERSAFSLGDVIEGVEQKMVSRHPHVFGDARADTPEDVEDRWKEAKRREGRTVLGGVPRSMPALDRSERLTARAAGVGFDFARGAEALAKLREELGELEAAFEGEPSAAVEELGDVLFAAVNVARHLGVSAAEALEKTNAKFERRFGFVERTLEGAGRSLSDATLEEMDALWDEAKRSER
jgi:MazG family protein